MKYLTMTVLLSGVCAIAMASSVEAKQVTKTYQSGKATRYTKGGDYDTVIGPKAKSGLNAKARGH